MRSASGTFQTELAKKTGTKPICEIGVIWVKNGVEQTYSDKDRLLELAGIDSVINAQANTESAEVSVKLSDVTGDLKEIFDNHDIHKRPAVVYQKFEGISDRMILLKGEISSPIVWKEADRTLSFNIISKLEDREVGFSPEAGQFDFVSTDLLGKPWPLVFGSCFHVPAAKVKETAKGTLKVLAGKKDTTLAIKYAEAQARQAELIALQAQLQARRGFAFQIAPEPIQILPPYLATIVDQDKKLKLVAKVLRKIDELQTDLEEEDDRDEQKRLTKALKVQNKKIVDMSEDLQEIATKKAQYEYQTQLAAYEVQLIRDLEGKIQEVTDAYEENYKLILKISDQVALQDTLSASSFIIDGGEKFPQGACDILVEGMRFSGSFSGEVFSVAAGPLPIYKNLEVQEGTDLLDAFYLVDETINLEGYYCLVPGGHVVQITRQVGRACHFELKELNSEKPELSTGEVSIYGPISDASQQALAEAFPIDQQEYQTIKVLENLEQPSLLFAPIPGQNWVIAGPQITTVLEVSKQPLDHWYNLVASSEELPEGNAWVAEIGAEVVQFSDPREIYIANILPSTVKQVSAYRELDGRKKLLPVPPEYYTLYEDIDLNDIHATGIILHKPLTQIGSQGWEDGLYVSLESSVGPNTVDILEWLIETYTEDGFDSSSFNDVKTKLTNYPMNFALLQQKDVKTVLSELAWQARCAIWSSNGTYYLRYLSETPSSVATLTEEDVIEGSMELTFTGTENLTTKITAEWFSSYSQNEPNKIILRHNVNKYGTNESTYQFYGYTDYDLVEKSATYWLIRGCNTWKILKLKTPLTNLRLETLDCVELDFESPYFSEGEVKGIIESANYDSDNNLVDLSIWLPIRAGESETYSFAWPSDISSTTEFPTQDDIAQGNAGLGIETFGHLDPLNINLDVGGRPPDYGRQLMSDGADAAKGNPLQQVTINGQVFAPGINGQLVPVRFPDLDDEVEVAPQARPRSAYIGVVSEKTDDERIFKVLTQDGRTLSAEIPKKVPWFSIEVGQMCMVVRGNGLDDWYLFAVPEITQNKQVKILEIKDDHLVCESITGDADDDVEDADEEILVAKPELLQVALWPAGSTKVGPDSEVGNYRRCRGVYEGLEPKYAVDDIITIAKLPTPPKSPLIANEVIRWVDSNVDARHFAPLLKSRVKYGSVVTKLVRHQPSGFSASYSGRISVTNVDANLDGWIPNTSSLFFTTDSTQTETFIEPEYITIPANQMIRVGSKVVSVFDDSINGWLTISSDTCAEVNTS